jgi:hypothetical protein
MWCGGASCCDDCAAGLAVHAVHAVHAVRDVSARQCGAMDGADASVLTASSDDLCGYSVGSVGRRQIKDK